MSRIVIVKSLKNAFLLVFIFSIFFGIFGCATKQSTFANININGRDFTIRLQNDKSHSCIYIFDSNTQDKLLQKTCLNIPLELVSVKDEDEYVRIQTFTKCEDDERFYTSVFLDFKWSENGFYLYQYGRERGYDNSGIRKTNTTRYFYRYGEEVIYDLNRLVIKSLNDGEMPPINKRFLLDSLNDKRLRTANLKKGCKD